MLLSILILFHFFILVCFEIPSIFHLFDLARRNFVQEEQNELENKTKFHSGGKKAAVRYK